MSSTLCSGPVLGKSWPKQNYLCGRFVCFVLFSELLGGGTFLLVFGYFDFHHETFCCLCLFKEKKHKVGSGGRLGEPERSLERGKCCQDTLIKNLIKNKIKIIKIKERKKKLI